MTALATGRTVVLVPLADGWKIHIDDGAPPITRRRTTAPPATAKDGRHAGTPRTTN
ncbi:hypothetical protein [Streptomyces sp. S.PB5]|uniref:hypothetical protein n=1 Tax=Streptomyces sp. S.PB5 TaxID=3020844 RepID=UPI0025AFD134|nr:hypothetical protein [Streptomyces sp. S.PB5]MDN3029404.1 hypothetical protein [Streptomyces sp. S.PB5]